MIIRKLFILVLFLSVIFLPKWVKADVSVAYTEFSFVEWSSLFQHLNISMNLGTSRDITMRIYNEWNTDAALKIGFVDAWITNDGLQNKACYPEDAPNDQFAQYVTYDADVFVVPAHWYVDKQATIQFPVWISWTRHGCVTHYQTQTYGWDMFIVTARKANFIDVTLGPVSWWGGGWWGWGWGGGWGVQPSYPAASEEEVKESLCTEFFVPPNKYPPELVEAYLWAAKLGITTKCNMDDADPYGKLIRKHLAKMLSEFAIKVRNKLPDESRVCAFDDIDKESKEMQYYAKLACKLGMMWLKYDGTPDISFNPNRIVTRAIFGTAISRLVYNGKYNGDSKSWFGPHLKALNFDGIMKFINHPSMSELRGYVRLMMMRADMKY